MELKDLIAVAWKRRSIIVVVTIVAVAVAVAIALLSTKRYESTSTLVLTPNTSQGQAGLVGSDDLTTLLPTYAAIVDSSSTLSRAAAQLGHPLNATVSAGTTAGTGILRVSATSTSPKDAAAAATAVSSAFTGSVSNKLLNIQVVGPAVVPSSPIAPRKSIIIGAGLILGIALGFALALSLDRWFDRVADPDDIVAATDLACLGSIPRTRALRGGGENSLMWRGETELLRAEESIRSLRTTLQLSMGSDAQVIQVTSPAAGEGKSTIAANLAVAIASLGLTTTVVDADFWAPRQHLIFKISNAHGLSTAIRESRGRGGTGSRHVPAPVPTAFEQLSVLPTGPVIDRPTEAIAAGIEDVLDELRERGDVIIVDTPPVLPVSDARLVAAHADLVVVIAAAERTKSSMLRLAIDQLRLAQSNIAGVVLNDTRKLPAGQVGYGDYAISTASLVSRGARDSGPAKDAPKSVAVARRSSARAAEESADAAAPQRRDAPARRGSAARRK